MIEHELYFFFGITAAIVAFMIFGPSINTGHDGVVAGGGHGGGFVVHVLSIGPQGALRGRAVTVLNVVAYAFMRIGASDPGR